MSKDYLESAVQFALTDSDTALVYAVVALVEEVKNLNGILMRRFFPLSIHMDEDGTWTYSFTVAPTENAHVASTQEGKESIQVPRNSLASTQAKAGLLRDAADTLEQAYAGCGLGGDLGVKALIQTLRLALAQEREG